MIMESSGRKGSFSYTQEQFKGTWATQSNSAAIWPPEMQLEMQSCPLKPQLQKLVYHKDYIL